MGQPLQQAQRSLPRKYHHHCQICGVTTTGVVTVTVWAVVTVVWVAVWEAGVTVGAGNSTTTVDWTFQNGDPQGQTPIWRLLLNYVFYSRFQIGVYSYIKNLE